MPPYGSSAPHVPDLEQNCAHGTPIQCQFIYINTMYIDRPEFCNVRRLRPCGCLLLEPLRKYVSHWKVQLPTPMQSSLPAFLHA